MSRRRLLTASTVYGLLAVAAMLWSGLRGDWSPWDAHTAWLPFGYVARLAVSLVGGALVAIATIAATRLLVRRTRWARLLHSNFRALLGPLSGAEIAAYALLSGLAEELFFRGAMLPAFGLALTSIIFGAVHVGPSRSFWVWTLWAGAMGLVFGALVALTGNLYGAVLAHFLINYENLHFIDAYDPDANSLETRLRGQSADASAPPKLSGTRMRTGR